MTDERSPAEYAGDIETARGQLLRLVRQCTDGDWSAAPVDGDLRAVGVILDHVAHSYEYLAGWISDIIAGQAVDVNPQLVDALNAEHASEAGRVTPAHVAGHLRSSGDALITLVAGLEPDQLNAGDGLVRRFATIAARHAESHRTEIEAALEAVPS